jgi:hypothetical protein
VTATELRFEWAEPDDRIRLLMLTNEAVEGTEYGFRDEFERLHREGDVAAYRAIAPRSLAGSSDRWVASARDAVAEIRPNVLLVLSPGSVDYEPAAVGALVRATGALVLYWEGDAWGRGKPMTPSMRTWARHADAVFSVAGSPQTEAFIRLGARNVQVIAQTYCHVQFATEEETAPSSAEPLTDVAMIGSRVRTLGMLSRMEGAADRARLARRLRASGLEVALYGRGWTGPAARGAIPYPAQIDSARQARLTANWDHFQGHAGFASDRLPISLLAGRVHLTSRHPGPSLYANDALVEVGTVDEAMAAVRELARSPWQELYERGVAGWEFARHRLSDRQAARHILRAVDRRIPAPPDEPWGSLERERDGRVAAGQH